jgi:hypothetical protein
MTGILQGNAALAVGVMALVFVLVSTVRMRRPTISVLAFAALFAVFVVFQVNNKLSSGEAVSASEYVWFANSGIAACLVLIVSCGIAYWLHGKYPFHDDCGREELQQSNAAVRVQR